MATAAPKYHVIRPTGMGKLYLLRGSTTNNIGWTSRKNDARVFEDLEKATTTARRLDAAYVLWGE